MIGEPPSSVGCCHDNSADDSVTSDTARGPTGLDGTSREKGMHHKQFFFLIQTCCNTRKLYFRHNIQIKIQYLEIKVVNFLHKLV